jgi:hypothetical protein
MLVQNPITQIRVGRVSEIIAGFETPFGMELLSTVHWVATREKAANKEECVKKTYAWSKRKRMFTPEQIGIAWDTLTKCQLMASNPA